MKSALILLIVVTTASSPVLADIPKGPESLGTCTKEFGTKKVQIEVQKQMETYQAVILLGVKDGNEGEYMLNPVLTMPCKLRGTTLFCSTTEAVAKVPLFRAEYKLDGEHVFLKQFNLFGQQQTEKLSCELIVQ